MAAPYDMLLTGGTVVSGSGRYVADVAIRGGKVALVGACDRSAAESTLDVSGLHVLPGVIDSQVHFREPGLTHKEDLATGTLAAVFGGVTTIFDEPNTDPTTTSEQALADKLARAAGRAWCHYAFWVGASLENLDDLGRLELLPGTPGIGEVFMGSSTGPLLVADDASLRRVLQNGVRRVAVHAEDEPRLAERRALLSDMPHPREHPILRDAESARLATERILRLSAETGRPVHVLHVSSADEIPLLTDAKRRGLRTTCEVTPQHLAFCARDYERLGTRILMNTPIRAAEHRKALWQALHAGVFDVVGSDHAPHTLEEKARPYPDAPSGMPGVQTLLPAMLDFACHGRLSVEQIVRMTAENPAAAFGVVGKGRVWPGYDADLAVVDLDGTFEVTATWLKSKCGWSPFEGTRLTGRVVHTVVGGSLAVRDGESVGRPNGRAVTFCKRDERFHSLTA